MRKSLTALFVNLAIGISVGYAAPHSPQVGQLVFNMYPNSLIGQMVEVDNPNSLYQVTCWAEQMPYAFLGSFRVYASNQQGDITAYGSETTNALTLYNIPLTKTSSTMDLDLSVQWNVSDSTFREKTYLGMVECLYQAESSN